MLSIQKYLRKIENIIKILQHFNQFCRKGLAVKFLNTLPLTSNPVVNVHTTRTCSRSVVQWCPMYVRSVCSVFCKRPLFTVDGLLNLNEKHLYIYIMASFVFKTSYSIWAYYSQIMLNFICRKKLQLNIRSVIHECCCLKYW